MLETVKSHCPCCGEPIHLVVDCSLDDQQYTEDCEVCCRPMIVSVSVYPDGPYVTVQSEEEA